MDIRSDNQFKTKFLFDFIAISSVFERKIIQKHGVRISQKKARPRFSGRGKSTGKMAEKIFRPLKTLITNTFRPITKVLSIHKLCDGMSVAGTSAGSPSGAVYLEENVMTNQNNQNNPGQNQKDQNQKEKDQNQQSRQQNQSGGKSGQQNQGGNMNNPGKNPNQQQGDQNNPNRQDHNSPGQRQQGFQEDQNQGRSRSGSDQASRSRSSQQGDSDFEREESQRDDSRNNR
jgi:hypothetical protein